MVCFQQSGRAVVGFDDVFVIQISVDHPCVTMIAGSQSPDKDRAVVIQRFLNHVRVISEMFLGTGIAHIAKKTLGFGPAWKKFPRSQKNYIPHDNRQPPF